MDNSRLAIATACCLAILLGWTYFADYMGWSPKPVPVAEESAPVNAPAPSAPLSAAAPMPRFAPAEGRAVKVETPLYSAVFHSAGGIAQSFELKNYSASIEPGSGPVQMISPAAAAVAPMGLLLNGKASWSEGQWGDVKNDLTLTQGQSGTLVFEGMVDGVRVTRSITFFADTYLMEENISLNADQGGPSAVRLSYTLAQTPVSSGSTYDATRMAWDIKGSVKEDSDVKDLTKEGLQQEGALLWAGTMTNYFLSAVAPEAESNLLFKARIQDDVWRVALEKARVDLIPGAPSTLAVNWWIGPKDRTLLDKAPGELSSASNMGMFGFLAVPLLWLLTAFYDLAGNWGVAIILLTVLIKVLFWPLTRKSYKSMEQMKKIQPMMKEVQQKYAGDKEAMSREMMQLYKTYGVNPMGGCLPILVQLPVFFALYQALLQSLELRHSAFITYLPFTDHLWLADLSAKDPYYITPVIMGATMFLQQWLSPAMGDPTQRKMMMLMPLIFSFMFLNFPSGLVLYWLCNNVLSIAQQWWTLRKA